MLKHKKQKNITLTYVVINICKAKATEILKQSNAILIMKSSN